MIECDPRRPLAALRPWHRQQPPGCTGRRVLHPPAVVRSHTACALLAGLALTLLVSGCGGPSPEARASQTRTALQATRTPNSLEAARTAIARGTFTGIDRQSRAILTAEASLQVRTPVPGIRTPVPGNVATHIAGNATD